MNTLTLTKTKVGCEATMNTVVFLILLLCFIPFSNSKHIPDIGVVLGCGGLGETGRVVEGGCTTKRGSGC